MKQNDRRQSRASNLCPQAQALITAQCVGFRRVHKSANYFNLRHFSNRSSDRLQRRNAKSTQSIRLGSAIARGYPIAMAPQLGTIPITNPIPNTGGLAIAAPRPSNSGPSPGLKRLPLLNQFHIVLFYVLQFHVLSFGPSFSAPPIIRLTMCDLVYYSLQVLHWYSISSAFGR